MHDQVYLSHLGNDDKHDPHCSRISEEKESRYCLYFLSYEKVSDHGPVWVREEVIFQVQEKRNFDSQNQHQMILLNVWSKDFTKKSLDHLF